MRYTTLILALLLIAGCGSKGPLYLPEEDPAAAEQSPASGGTSREPVQEPVEEQEEDTEKRL